MNIPRISAEAFAVERKNGAHILDVRTPVEYRAVHVEGAVLCPIDQLDPANLQQELKGRGFEDQDTLYLLCKSGARATRAAERIVATSDIKVAVVEGGTEACVRAGLPIETATEGSGISLERQVRIAAGTLVLIGVLLGYWATPYGFWFSGFVGAGLIFAGVTGTCAMGMFLAKMPWNK